MTSMVTNQGRGGWHLNLQLLQGRTQKKLEKTLMSPKVLHPQTPQQVMTQANGIMGVVSPAWIYGKVHQRRRRKLV